MMNMDEAIDRVHALDRWVCLYPRSNTFAQFHADYAAQDPALKAFLDANEHEDCPQDLIDALSSLGESVDMGQFLESQDKPWRRISDGPSYSRDKTMDDLYTQLPPDYRVSEAIADVFEPIKVRLHSNEWLGKSRREQLDWLVDELQELIYRIQTPESAAVVHAYLFDFIDKYGVEGTDLDAVITETLPADD